MRILLSNDDGYLAPGIQALFNALSVHHDVVIFAPDRDVSGSSCALTLRYPVHVTSVNDRCYSVSGSAADSTHIALNGFFKKPFDVVITGINAGANFADDIWHSGTVGAAREGRFLPNAPIAFSLVDKTYEFLHYQTVIHVLLKFLESKFYQKNKHNRVLFNINVPSIPFQDIKKFCITTLADRHSTQAIIPLKTPKHKTVYWIGPTGKISENNTQMTTDFEAVNNQCVSITPISLNTSNLFSQEISDHHFE